jgi:hypothetical protein
MPFTVEGESALTETYKIRLSPEDKQAIQQQAEAAAMSMAKFMRFRSLGYVVISKADMTVLAELRRIGGLLKQAINKLPSEGQAGVFQTMAALRDYTKELTRDRQKDSQSK